MFWPIFSLQAAFNVVMAVDNKVSGDNHEQTISLLKQPGTMFWSIFIANCHDQDYYLKKKHFWLFGTKNEERFVFGIFIG